MMRCIIIICKGMRELYRAVRKIKNFKKCFTNQGFGDIMSKLEPVFSAFGRPFLPLLRHRV